MKDLIILTGYKISSEVRETEKGCNFAAYKVKSYNNLQKKVWVNAFDTAYQICKHLKLKRGSIVDMTCEVYPTQDQDGNYRDLYKVINISISDSYEHEQTENGNTNNETTPEPKETDKNDIRSTARMLATNPWSKN